VRVNRRDAHEMGNATPPGAQPHSNEVSNTDIHRFTHVYGDNFPNPCINLMHTPPLIETTPSPISLAHRYCAMQQEADCLGRP
jgi:hypothetical protein